MNSVHGHLVRTNSIKVKELPIPAQSPNDEQANSINFTKAKELSIPARSPKGPTDKFYKIC